MVKYTDKELLNHLKKISLKLGKTPTRKEFNLNSNIHSSIYERRFGTWNNSLINAKLKLNIRFNYTKEELIGYLIKWTKENGRVPKFSDFQGQTPSASLYGKRLGSWNNALKEAGLEINHEMDYSKKYLLKKLDEFIKEIGRFPTSKEINKNQNIPSAQAYRNKWGKLSNLSKIKNLKQVQHKWTDEEIISSFNKVKKDKRRTPTESDFMGFNDRPSYSVITRHFGNLTNLFKITNSNLNQGFLMKIWVPWQNFCEEIAIYIHGEYIRQYKLSKKRHCDIFIPKKKLIVEAMTSAYTNYDKKKELKDYAKYYPVEVWCIHKGKEIKSKNIKYFYAQDLSKILKLKGHSKLSNKCLEFYNLPDSMRKERGMWTKKELLDILKKAYKKIKVNPSYKMIKEKIPNCPSREVYLSNFGSFRKALTLAGFKKNLRYDNPTKKELISQLQNLSKRIKKKPSINDIDKDEYCASSPTFRKIFGSLPLAIKESGLEFTKNKNIIVGHGICVCCKKKYKIIAETPNKFNFLLNKKKFCSRKCKNSYRNHH